MKTPSKYLPYFIIVALAIIWGSSFILMKRGMLCYSSGQVAAMRIFIAFLCLLPFTWSKIKTLQKKDWKYLIASGFLGNGIPAFLFTYAETGISSSLAGILNSLTPLFTLIVGYFLFKSKVRAINILGVLIGFGGTAWLLLDSPGGHQQVQLSYALLVILATVCYAFSVNIIKTYLHHLDSILISGGALLVVGPLCGLYLCFTDILSRSATNPMALTSFMYIFVLGFMGTAVSLLYFNKLIKMSSALFASSTTYFIPIVALFWGMADHESMGYQQVVAMGIILSGMYLINKKAGG